nr:hypothetical protein [Haliscomenobacter hydrossis]
MPKGPDFLSLEVPKFGGVVVTSGEDVLAIGGESDGGDVGGVPLESADFLSLEVPEFDRVVAITSGEAGFKLKIKNTGYRTLWVSLLYLSEDFGISNVLLPKQALNAGEEVNAADVVNGFPYFVIPLRLEEHHSAKGIHAIEECLKVIISTEEFNTDLFNQKGLPPDEEPMRPTRAVGRVKDVVTKDWRTLEIWVRIERGEESMS